MRRKTTAIRDGDLLPIEKQILVEVRERGSVHGLPLCAVLTYPKSTVYRALRRLEAAGLLKSEWEDAKIGQDECRPQRRVYQLTQAD